jgi:predicted O-methyltransferase YrrM
VPANAAAAPLPPASSVAELRQRVVRELAPFIASDGDTCSPLGRGVITSVVNERMTTDKSLGHSSYTAEFTRRVLMRTNYSDKTVFECGGGFSTLWWASRAKFVVAGSHQASLLCALRASLGQLNLTHKSVVVHAEPARLKEPKARLPGCMNLVEKLALNTNFKFDVIVVDGDGDSRCDELMASLSLLAPGGVIIADNWNQPAVWNPCPCCAEIEAKYKVNHYFHPVWAWYGHPGHERGWQTVVFSVDAQMQPEFRALLAPDAPLPFGA